MRQTVTSDLSKGQAGINPGDTKVDVDNVSQEEKQVQDQVSKEMAGAEGAETVSAPDAEESGNKDAEIPTNEGYDNGFVNLDEEEEAEEGGEEKPEAGESEEEPGQELDEYEKIRLEAKKEAEREFLAKYKPNEQKGENIRLAKENEELKKRLDLSTTDYLVEEKKSEIYREVFSKYKDIIPDASLQNILAYQQSADESLVLNDPYLSRLNQKLTTIGQLKPDNVLLDLKERVESAIILAFHNEILEKRNKQEIVKKEMDRQTIDRTVEPGARASAQTGKAGYSEAQQKVADAWGVTLN